MDIIGKINMLITSESLRVEWENDGEILIFHFMSKKVKCGKHCFVFSFSVLLFSVVIFRRVFKNPSRITQRGQAAIN